MDSFKQRVIQLMSTVPDGRVTTYGDIAAHAGQVNAARIVGGIAHYGPVDVPWHRLVNRAGKLANGFPGGIEVQAELLKNEGVEVKSLKVVSFDRLRWRYDEELGER